MLHAPGAEARATAVPRFPCRSGWLGNHRVEIARVFGDKERKAGSAESREDKGRSLTDCSSKWGIRERGTFEGLTHDEHFA